MEAEPYDQELAHSKRALLSAHKLFEKELCKDCVSRTYYSVLPAAKAALVNV